VIVVSDTSPILNLATIGRLNILRSLYGQIVLPLAVANELTRHGIQIEPGWMSIVAAHNRAGVAQLRLWLDPGEAEAIIVALELQASLILIDEQRGRRIAADQGLEYMGLLGILSEAKQRGLIPECKPILDGMIQHAGFWIGNDLRYRFLVGVGEQP
jgi:predicted nucleic acid-binding protein